MFFDAGIPDMADISVDIKRTLNWPFWGQVTFKFTAVPPASTLTVNVTVFMPKLVWPLSLPSLTFGI